VAREEAMVDDVASLSDQAISAELLHRAGEAEQKRLVPEIAADGPSALTVLVQAYHESRTGRLRCCILDVLPGFDDPRVLPILAAGLEDDSSSVRGHAVEALLQRRDPEACALLLPLLADRNAAVRCRAVAAVAQLDCRSEAVISELLRCARDPDWRIRQAAARALGAMSVAAAGDALLDLTTDPRNAVRVAAEQALEQLQPRP
jgi:HEAT repeat protein